MKKIITYLFAITLLSMLLPGCATIVSRTSYPVAINSHPDGATVTITDRKGIEIYKGMTPVKLKLKSGAGFFTNARYSLKFNMEGYNESMVNITSSLNGWYFGNILIGGFLGMLIIDPATGAMWKLDQQYFDINLVPTDQQVLNILDVKDLPEEYKQHLIRIN